LIEIGSTQEEASEVGTRSGTKEVMQRQRHPRGIFGMKRPLRWRDRLLVSGRQEVVPFCITSHRVDIEERLMDNTKDGYTTLPDHSKIISCYEDGFWDRSTYKLKVTLSRCPSLEAWTCLRRRKEGISRSYLLYREGQVTGCRCVPLQCASIGWGFPAEHTGGRYIEPGEEPPILLFFCNFFNLSFCNVFVVGQDI